MPKSILSKKFTVSKDQWVLSFVVRKEKPGHTVLVLEGTSPEETKNTVYLADLVTENTKDAHIQLIEKDNTFLSTYLAKGYSSYSWQISMLQGERFLDHVQAEAKNTTVYLPPSKEVTWKEVASFLNGKLDATSFSAWSSSIITDQESGHNSLSWALYLLKGRNLRYIASNDDNIKETDIVQNKGDSDKVSKAEPIQLADEKQTPVTKQKEIFSDEEKTKSTASKSSSSSTSSFSSSSFSSSSSSSNSSNLITSSVFSSQTTTHPSSVSFLSNQSGTTLLTSNSSSVSS